MAFNEVNIAKQEKEQLVNQAKGVYNKVIPEASGKAERVVAESEAYTISMINHAEGMLRNISVFSSLIVKQKR